MGSFQLVCLLLVAIMGTAVVFTPSPLRQTMVLGLYGFALTLLFFAFQAPDVALSELVVGAVAMPIIVLAALRRLAEEPAGAADEDAPAPEAGG